MPRLLMGRLASRVLLLVSVLANALLLLYLHSSLAPLPCPEYDYQSAGEGPASRSLLRQPPENTSSSISSDFRSRMVIFVGGVPRSGTTLMRAMLDAHPEVRCGEETRVIPRVISMRSRWDKASKEQNRLTEAGISGKMLDDAMRAFMAEIILNHGPPAKFLCNKDPLLLNYMQDLVRIFPAAKFVLMIRDGRAVAHSIVTRNITISGVDHRNYMSAALFWNKVVGRMVDDCKDLKEECLTVYYEKLVTSPHEEMKRVLSFLTVPWSNSVLHHHELIDKEVSLSK